MAVLRVVRRLFWPAVAVAVVLAFTTPIEPVYVFAPLLGLAIWRVGLASFMSLQGGAGHIPEGEPEVVDTRVERTTYWCGGCGAEVLLLVRGTATPPRHCGERMHERTEVARDALN